MTGAPTRPDYAGFIDLLIDDSHGAAVRAGWYHDIKTGERKSLNVGERLMLCVSELAEAMEGHRKGLMDDKLPIAP